MKAEVGSGKWEVGSGKWEVFVCVSGHSENWTAKDEW